MPQWRAPCAAPRPCTGERGCRRRVGGGCWWQPAACFAVLKKNHFVRPHRLAPAPVTRMSTAVPHPTSPPPPAPALPGCATQSGQHPRAVVAAAQLAPSCHSCKSGRIPVAPPPASAAPSITGSPPTRAARGAGTRPHGRQRAAALPLPSSGYPLSMKRSGERRRRVRERRESAAVAAAAGQAGDPPPPGNTGGAASRRRRRPRAWPCRADQRGGTAARSGRGSNRTGGPAVQRPTRPAVSPAPLHGRPPSSAGSQTHR